LKENVLNISSYRSFNRSYKPDELLGEIKNLISCDGYEDFIFIAGGNSGRAMRFSSRDMELRYGDVLLLLELCKDDLKELL